MAVLYFQNQSICNFMRTISPNFLRDGAVGVYTFSIDKNETSMTTKLRGFDV